ncbi:hypothetical protein [Microseira wollei]|nr:hypothetical protein [Microseira wollei]
MAKITLEGQDAHPTRVIVSGGVGVPPAQEFDQRDFSRSGLTQTPKFL